VAHLVEMSHKRLGFWFLGEFFFGCGREAAGFRFSSPNFIFLWRLSARRSAIVVAKW